ncbi:DUF1553 domain-containing protein [bacterium]|nr:DUF1553 domain-containing protein [bacterium]
MMTLDAADRSYCTVRRQSTNTPLQSLVLLNDPQFVEAARVAAERMMRLESVPWNDRWSWLFRSVTSRTPRPREVEILQAAFEEQKALFASDASAAQKIIGVGEKPADAQLDVVELAAATVVVQAVFNHDESVRRR